MSLLTSFFNLIKPQKTDPAAIADINSNFDIIDTEMHRPPLTVNGTEPDSERDIEITTVPLADNLTSDESQINSATFLIRTSGGEASVADGAAWLTNIRGEMRKTGYVEESLVMTVNAISTETPITATIDRDVFVEYVAQSGTITLTYINDWSEDPALYGVTVSGTPAAGDQIVITYTKLNRGTIATATPSTFRSTGWNLYRNTDGYARLIRYSDEYWFMIEGSYTALEFSPTLNGDRISITPVDGSFSIPSDGYLFVAGGNATDTAVWMTWSDWTDGYSGGFEPYTETTVDLTPVMVNFPNGLMRIGNTYDEIDLNTQIAYSRIERLAYTAENLETVIESGMDYDTDTNYIYAVRQTPVTYAFSLDGEYVVSDHGLEIIDGSEVSVYAQMLYGQDLKGKLRRDVLTISAQTLSSAQKAQVQENLGLNIANNLTTTAAGSVLDARQGKALNDSLTSLSDSLANCVPITISSSFSTNSSAGRVKCNVTLPNAYKGLLALTCARASNSGAGLWLISVSSVGDVYVDEIYSAGQSTITASTNAMTIVNTASTAAVAIFMNFAGTAVIDSYTAAS